MNFSSERETILAKLNLLIDQAEREDKWLQNTYCDFAFTPQKLREENAKGKFIWGPVNWELIDSPDVTHANKFSEFIKMCKSKDADVVIIAYPEVLGDTYEEVMKNLKLLYNSGKTLLIVPEKS